MCSVRITSTLTPTPSDERTSLTGTSNAISRVVTTWVSASTGLTRWMPSVSTRSWCPAFTTSPTEPGGTRMNSRDTIPTSTAATAATMITARSAGEQRQEQARRGEGDRDQDPLDLDRRDAADAHDDRHPAVRVAALEHLAGIGGRRRRLGDLDVGGGEGLRLVERDGLRLRRRRRLRRVVGHGWVVLRVPRPARRRRQRPRPTGTAGGRVEATASRGPASRWR